MIINQKEYVRCEIAHLLEEVRISKIFIKLFFVIAVGLFSLNAFAEEASKGTPNVQVYNDSDYAKLADASFLMISLGEISDYGTLPFATSEGVMRDILRTATKMGATGVHKTGEEQGYGTNSWGVSGYQLRIKADAFKFTEPTAQNIKTALHGSSLYSELAIRNAINNALKQKFTELADDILMEVLAYKASSSGRQILLDGYAALQVDGAIEGLRKVATDSKDKIVRVKAGQLLARKKDTEVVYNLILNSDDYVAEKLTESYAEVAGNKDIERFRKLFKLHNSENVRIEAGKVLVKLKDNDSVESILKSEQSVKVSEAVKKALLLQ